MICLGSYGKTRLSLRKRRNFTYGFVLFCVHVLGFEWCVMKMSFGG